MDITLITATGLKISCAAVTAGAMYPVLHIHTAALDGAAAWQIFSDPAETETLTVVRDESFPPEEEGGAPVMHETRETYLGYTALYSVGSSPFVPGALLIWLNYDAAPQA